MICKKRESQLKDLWSIVGLYSLHLFIVIFDNYTYVLFCNIIFRYIVHLVGWEVSLPVKNIPLFKSNPVCCHCSYLLFICVLCWCCLLLCKIFPRGRLKCFLGNKMIYLFLFYQHCSPRVQHNTWRKVLVYLQVALESMAEIWNLENFINMIWNRHKNALNQELEK